MNQKPIYLRSQEVVTNFQKKSDGAVTALGYARAFGAAWALLTKEQQSTLLAYSEKEKESN